MLYHITLQHSILLTGHPHPHFTAEKTQNRDSNGIKIKQLHVYASDANRDMPIKRFTI